MLTTDREKVPVSEAAFQTLRPTPRFTEETASV